MIVEKPVIGGRSLEPIRWHAPRRVFAALLQDEGIPLERIRDLMGHSGLRVTEGYTYAMPDPLNRDMSAIDDAISDASAKVRDTESDDGAK